ncbi:MAG: hypothetical protein CO189_00050 [candidate division Zixibacteria bacterium CG_4_9_14_3_um_filter_46_8]|nr:MAG: hypothetical protein CO189_00050 [candidate division Zixibacteria bacterium CG_4_9_14_3_um_filter_46_8]
MTRAAEKEVSLLGINLCNCSVREGLDILDESLEMPGHYRAMFMNANYINISFSDPVYRETVKKYHARFVDGVGVYLAGRILKGVKFPHLGGGTDLGKLFLERCAQKGYRVFFLGARPGVADKAAENFRKWYPNIKIVGCHHGYFHNDENEDIIRRINSSKADVLLVCMGMPREALWIEENFDKLKTRLSLPLGAFFDFHSGEIRRAPLWIQKLRFEWLFRLILEPNRLWKRYIIGNFIFIGRVFKWKLLSIS